MKKSPLTITLSIPEGFIPEEPKIYHVEKKPIVIYILLNPIKNGSTNDLGGSNSEPQSGNNSGLFQWFGQGFKRWRDNRKNGGGRKFHPTKFLDISGE